MGLKAKEEWEAWEALHRAMDAKERRDEVQRAAHIAANKSYGQLQDV